MSKTGLQITVLRKSRSSSAYQASYDCFTTDSLIQKEFVFSPFLAHWDCSRISSQHPMLRFDCCSGKSSTKSRCTLMDGEDKMTLSSATEEILEQMLIQHPPHFKIHNTEALFQILPYTYAKNHPQRNSRSFPAITHTLDARLSALPAQFHWSHEAARLPSGCPVRTHEHGRSHHFICIA